MSRTISIAVKYPRGYDGPGLPPVSEVMAAGAQLCRVGRRYAVRFPTPDQDVVLVDRERLTVEKLTQVREAWTRLALQDFFRT